MENIFQKQAKANLKAGGQSRELLKQPWQNSANHNVKKIEPVETELPQNFAKPLVPMETRQEIANIAHVSRDTVSKVKFIEENATDDQKEDLANGTKGVSIHNV